ncbi:hypothetical protein BDZ91DRAFT_765767 [Kalaharituber pfeilii]|nr:hypothetical protein BDZ91DRAFT_765767 [Kalaharituber pfeilii]
MTNFHGLPVVEIIGFMTKPKFPSIRLALGDQAQDYVRHALINYVGDHITFCSSGSYQLILKGYYNCASPCNYLLQGPQGNEKKNHYLSALNTCIARDFLRDAALLKSNPHTSNLPASSLPMRDHVEDTLLNLFVVSVAILLLTLLFLLLNAAGVPILISRHMTIAADLALQKQQQELEVQIGKVKMEEKAEERRERAEERRLQREWDRWKLEKEWDERKQKRELELKWLEVELARLQRQRAPSFAPSRSGTPAEGIEWGVPVEVEPTPLE